MAPSLILYRPKPVNVMGYVISSYDISPCVVRATAHLCYEHQPNSVQRGVLIRVDNLFARTTTCYVLLNTWLASIGFSNVESREFFSSSLLNLTLLLRISQRLQSIISDIQRRNQSINQSNQAVTMNVSILSSAMEGVAWRGLLYTVFILHFVLVCQLLLLQPLVSALGTSRSRRSAQYVYFLEFPGLEIRFKCTFWLMLLSTDSKY